MIFVRSQQKFLYFREFTVRVLSLIHILWLEKNTDKIKITLNDKIKEYSELKEEYSKGLING